jgi:hypothetical protein
MRSAIRGTVAVLAVTAVALVACGSTARLTKAQYEQRVRSIGAKAGTTLTKVFSNPSLLAPKSLKEAADIVRSGAATIDDAGSQLQHLKPPPDAETDNDQLATAFHQLATELRQWADAAEKGDLQAVKTFDEQLRANELPGELLIQRSIEDLKAKGYQLGT